MALTELQREELKALRLKYPEPVVPSEAPEQKNSTVLDSIGRGLGLAARAAAPYAAAAGAGAIAGAPFAGVGAIPGAIAGMGAYTLGSTAADLTTGLRNFVAKNQMEMPSAAVNRGLTGLGFPEPKTVAENIASVSGQTALGGFSGLRLAQQLRAQQAARPYAAELTKEELNAAPSTNTTFGRATDMLTQQPNAQLVAAPVAGAAAQGTRELGAQEPIAMLAGFGAGVLPFTRVSNFLKKPPALGDRVTLEEVLSRNMAPKEQPLPFEQTPKTKTIDTIFEPDEIPPMKFTAAAPGPVRQSHVDRLKRANIPVTPGQESGNAAAQTFESVLKYMPASAGRVAKELDLQHSANTRALLKFAGIDSDRATPDVMKAAQDNFGKIYKILEKNTVLTKQGSEKLADDLLTAEQNYGRGFTEDQRSSFYGYRDELLKLAAGDAPAGTTYQAMDSGLTAEITNARKSSSPGSVRYANALQDLRLGLRNLMQENTNPKVAAAWRDTNKKYAIFKHIEKAMLTTDQATLNSGYISPKRLATISMRKMPKAWTQGDESIDDFNNLVKSGAAIIPDPIPNSGTAQRTFMTNQIQGISNLARGSLGGAAATTAGAAATVGGALLNLKTLVAPAIAAKMYYAKPTPNTLSIKSATLGGTQPKVLTEKQKRMNAMLQKNKEQQQ